MTVLFSRAITRLVALLVLPVLGLVAAAFAVTAITPGSVAGWASDARLTDAWDQVGVFLDRTAPAAETVVVVSAVGAVALGLVLLIGAFAGHRRRDVDLMGSDQLLSIRRRALRQAMAFEVQGASGTTSTKVRLRSRRNRVRVAGVRSAGVDPEPVRSELSAKVATLAEAFGLRPKVKTHQVRSRTAKAIAKARVS